MHQSIETTALDPRPPRKGGESNIWPVLKW